MDILARLVPIATVLALALLCVVPWGFGAWTNFALPALPFTAIHYWSRKDRAPLAAPLVFLTGLGVDVLSHGPLGYWSLIYLTGMALTFGLEEGAGQADGLRHWLGFCSVLAMLMLLAWLLASAYFARLIDWWPMLTAAFVLPAIYPVVAAILLPVDRWMAGPRMLRLERRG